LHENFALQRDKSLRTVAFFRSLLGAPLYLDCHMA